MRQQVATAESLEAAATIIGRNMYEELSESTVLVRTYALVPYREVPEDVRSFVDTLVQTAGTSVGAVQPTTPVLSLLASYGARVEWQDRRQSRAHKGIPLVSAGFVDAIPMLARLLKELGIDLAWLDDAPEVLTRSLVGGFNGLFFVDDARAVRDAKRRLVIPAADFVETEGVRSVFGMGGFYPNGTMIVTIVFTRELLKRTTVDRFASLVSMLKGETFRLIMKRAVFATA